jgi:hypothetical protein
MKREWMYPAGCHNLLLKIFRINMEGMTTEDKLLAQDDIDALLGEAGIEGNYETKETTPRPHHSTATPSVRFGKISNDDVMLTISLLRNKAFLERGDDVKVIWNASGTIPLASGFNLNIQEMEYVSLGVLHENHLVVRVVPHEQS